MKSLYFWDEAKILHRHKCIVNICKVVDKTTYCQCEILRKNCSSFLKVQMTKVLFSSVNVYLNLNNFNSKFVLLM